MKTSLKITPNEEKSDSSTIIAEKKESISAEKTESIIDEKKDNNSIAAAKKDSKKMNASEKKGGKKRKLSTDVNSHKPTKRHRQIKCFTEENCFTGEKLKKPRADNSQALLRRRRYMLKYQKRDLKKNKSTRYAKMLKKKHEQIFSHLWRAHWQMDNAMFLLSKLTEKEPHF